MPIMDTVKNVGKNILPGIAQYPFERLHKAYENIRVLKRKIESTRVKLWSGIGTGAVFTTLTFVIAPLKTVTVSAATAAAGSAVAGPVIVAAGTFLLGVAVGSKVSKEVLRYRNRKKGLPENSELHPLTEEETTHLKKNWGVEPSTAKKIMDFLVKRKKVASEKVEQAKQPLIQAHANDVTAKIAIQNLRKACQNPESNLNSVIKYLEQEDVNAKQQIKLDKATFKRLVDGKSGDSGSDSKKPGSDSDLKKSDSSKKTAPPDLVEKENDSESEDDTPFIAIPIEDEKHKRKLTDKRDSFWIEKQNLMPNHSVIEPIEENLLKQRKIRQELKVIMGELADSHQHAMVHFKRK